MSLYILVEGKQTERKLYPVWLAHICPELIKVESPRSLVNNNSYYLISGEGYPRLLDVELKNSLRDIEENKSVRNFWVILDSDGVGVDVRRREVLDCIDSFSSIDIRHCSVEVIVQNPCIETWGFGNKSIISLNQLHDEFRGFFTHYNVRDLDPELMSKPREYVGTLAAYHESYLRCMLRQKQIRYRKNNPNGLIDVSYLEKMISRANDGASHLKSFKHFLELANGI